MSKLKLDEFTKAYIDCLFFTEPENDEGERESGELGMYDFTEEALQTIVTDCERFQRENETLLLRAYRRNDDSGEQYSSRRAGHDFCYSRNGHGTGFWDRLRGPIGNQLHKRAQAFGEQNVIRNEDALNVE